MQQEKTAGLPVLFKGLDFSSSGFPLGLRTRWVQDPLGAVCGIC